jgi:arylsulfatase A-like enzyme
VKVVRAALRWAGSVPPEDPYFLWVHLFDPHQPYNPPPEYRAGLDPEMAAAHPSLQWDDFTEIARRNGGDVPAAVLEHARALYRGEVSYADHWVGRLVEGLDALGRRKEPIVVLTADHGECFEKGVFFEHSDCLYEGTSHVPLIVRDPPDFAPGARVEEQVSLVDLAPTVLAAAGIPIPAHFSGRPLQRHAEAGDDRYVLLQHPFYQPRAALGRVAKQKVIRSVGGVPTAEILVGEERVGVVGRDWKLIRTEGEAGPSEGELDLYPMSPRPDESQDLAARRADVRDALEARLDALLEEHPLHIVAPAAINEELRETLEALGYLE